MGVRMKFATPAPWVAGTTLFEGKRHFAVIAPGPDKAAALCGLLYADDELESIANSVLIAAAHELRDALQELADAAEARENPMGDPCALLSAQARLRDAAKVARAALSKSNGGMA